MVRLKRRSASTFLNSARRAFSLRQDLQRLSAFFGHPSQRPQPPSHSDAILNFLGRNPEHDCRLDHGALLIASENVSRAELQWTEQELKALTDKLRPRLSGVSAGDRLVTCVNDFLYQQEGFVGTQDRDHESLLKQLLLPQVLRERKGHCLGLGLLTLILCQRLGLPVYGASAPGHFFCRYNDGRSRINIETTLQGKEWSDARYAEKYKLTREALERGLYLRTLSNREVLAEVLNNRGHYYWRCGMQEEAILDLYRATRASPKMAKGHTSKGFMALCRGHIEVAVVELGQAVDIDPWSPRANLHLGEALLEAKRPGMARDILRRAVELSPESSFAHSLLARSLGSNQAEEARQAHEQAVRLDPNSCLAWNNYGVFLAATGDAENALNAFVQALDSSPYFPIAAENLVRLTARSDDERHQWLLGDIREGYEQQLTREPDDRSVQLCLARFLMALGQDLNRAQDAAQRAHELKPDARSYELLAGLAFRQQQLIKARRLAVRGLSMSPGSRARRQLTLLLKRVDRALSLAYE